MNAWKEKISSYVEAHREELLEDIRALVAIRSDRQDPKPGRPFGDGPVEALNLAMELGKKYGFKVTDYNDVVCAIDLDPCQAGTGEPNLDILAHLDVVPVGNDWTVTEPFTMKEVDGCIYGRGTADDKGPAMTALLAMRAVKDLGIPITKRVRLILGTDEECGSADIEYYYDREPEAPMTFSPDGNFPLINIEKGGLQAHFTASFAEDRALPRVFSVDGGFKFNVAPATAEAVIEGMSAGALAPAAKDAECVSGVSFQLTDCGTENAPAVRIVTKGTAAHASLPDGGRNGLTALVSFLGGLPLADSEGFRKLSWVARTLPYGDFSGQAAGIARYEEQGGPLTISFDIFHYTTTSLEGMADCRAALTCSNENTRDVLLNRFAEGGITMDPEDMYEAHIVPGDSAFVRKLLDCYEVYSGQKGKPIAIGGGTYVHSLKRGVAFGCCVDGFDNREHGADERAEVSNLLMSAKIFALTIAELCQ